MFRRFQIKNVAFITGSAGFIGFHLSNYLLCNGWIVVGLDSMNDYYNVKLKKDRLEKLLLNSNFHNYQGLVQDQSLLETIYSNHQPNYIIHLAAQAGVRFSIENPLSYVESNLIGTFHILEIARKFKTKHLLIASTSSVYGSSQVLPFHENQKSDTPLSFYAATKKSNEVMAHSYSHLYNIPTTMLRFFTVYGPWGRPDMALFKFTRNILSEIPINVFNNGKMKRDFTYINDLVKAIYLLISKIPDNINKKSITIPHDSISNVAPFRVVNIGNSAPINILDYVDQLEKILGKKAKINFLDMQNGEVKVTYSDINLLYELTGYKPKTSLSEGILEFVKWYKSYYQ